MYSFWLENSFALIKFGKQVIARGGKENTRRLANHFDGISRHSSEGKIFKRHVNAAGWKQLAQERIAGDYDCSFNVLIVV